jgi:hypothetical protein
MMAQTLEELRLDIKHMDRVELLAFGRLHRANPESAEYLEAQAEWERRKDRYRKQPPMEYPADRPTSEELSEMARKAGPFKYPWTQRDA